MNHTTLARFLRQIPQYDEPPQPLPSNASERAYVQGALAWLELWGIVRVSTEGVRASAQTSKYALNSLAAALESGQTLVDDWQTLGMHFANPLHNGATLLHWVELQRMSYTPDAPPSRVEHVVQVLIKRIDVQTGEHAFLMQYDQNANQYQLIGGRVSPRDNGDTLATITREISEELPLAELRYGQDYQLALLADNFQPPHAISPTFGALTQYHFTFYHMHALRRPLALREGDRWVTLRELLLGAVQLDQDTYHPFQGTNIYHLLDQRLTGGLKALADSTS